MFVVYGKKDCPETAKVKEFIAKLKWPTEYRVVDE